VNSTHGVPTIPTMIAATSSSSHSVDPDSSREPMRRPGGMCTTDAGSATGCSAPSISPVSRR
jgi:hypothetical protein